MGGLGPANGLQHVVRVAVGFDARDGGFVSAAHGMGEDKVESVIRIEQARFQTQA